MSAYIKNIIYMGKINIQEAMFHTVISLYVYIDSIYVKRDGQICTLLTILTWKVHSVREYE